MLVVSAVLIVIVGLGIAALRTLRGPLWFPVRALAAAYTDFFRGMPLIILLYLVGFGVPGLQLQGVPTSPVVLGTLALVLTYSAYVAEVFRAGIESVHPSQRAAARSLGLSYGQTMRRVVLPQAVRRVTPPLLNDFVALQKDVGLISVLGAYDAVRLRADPRRRHVQLHAVPGGRAAVRAARHPDHPGRRLVQPACGTPAAGERARCDRRRVTAEPPGDIVLSCEGVVKRFGDHTVLRSVDLQVAEHQVVTLIGASGSGKSSLLRCINLLETVDDGVIRLDGEDITDPRVDADAVRRRIGVVFQAYNLFPHMSVLDNVTLAPRLVGKVAREQAEDRARTLLERVGLADKAQEYPDRLSGGQQQRVAIVRALANEPRLLLLDEVTSALDPELVGEVLSLVRELKEQGMTIVMATHEMSFARQAADRVVFLDGGVVLRGGAARAGAGRPRAAAHPAVPGPHPRGRPALEPASGSPQHWARSVVAGCGEHAAPSSR